MLDRIKEPTVFIFQRNPASPTLYDRFTFADRPEKMILPKVEMFISNFKKGRLTPDVIEDELTKASASGLI
jgi:hypothetical protein